MKPLRTPLLYRRVPVILASQFTDVSRDLMEKKPHKLKVDFVESPCYVQYYIHGIAWPYNDSDHTARLASMQGMAFGLASFFWAW